MKDWRIFVSDTLVKWWKQIGVLGWVRFRILRWAYKVFWSISPRNGEWDFVLSWMRPLRKWQNVRVLDVGATESLLVYELAHRGYEIDATDQRDYQEKLPSNIIFFKMDITDNVFTTEQYFKEYYDYIISISVVEHIGLGAYGDNIRNRGDRLALQNIHYFLKPNGYFIITVPNKHLGTDTGRGYSYQDFEKLIEGLFRIVYFTERSNQLCAVLVKFQ